MPPKLKESAIAGILIVFAILDFLAAILGIVLISSHLSGERQFGWLLVFAGFGGGVVLLAFAKIVECLHEAVYRLRSIQSLLEK